MPIEKNYFSIAPLNDNPLQSVSTDGITGGFSFKESNPIVKFSLPAVEKLLETNTLVLTGQFIVKDSDTNEGFHNANLHKLEQRSMTKMFLSLELLVIWKNLLAVIFQITVVFIML